MSKTYDLIIIGGGSIGVPTALTFARRGRSVLVIDARPSAGQGDNKKAIGGIRATHSDKGKIKVCQRSIEIFSTWQEAEGDDIHWRNNGYSFPAYTEELETSLKELMKIQHGFGLEIEWVSAEDYQKLNPGINMDGLRGSTFSAGDGSASPLIFVNSASTKAVEAGAEFRFNERVTGLKIDGDRIVSVVTDKGEYSSAAVLNAAGASARQIANMAGLDVPVTPDCHEAAISEPVKPFMGPMVVDLRRGPGCANFYFYQLKDGQIIFCLTPDPPIVGVDTRSTSVFLPLIARRMIDIMPRLANLKVRRTWRGQYPMTPDGFPIVGRMEEIPNFYQAVGMCGQGFMLGPGLAELIYRLVTDQLTDEDPEILKSFDPYRDFSGEEAFK